MHKRFILPIVFAVMLCGCNKNTSNPTAVRPIEVRTITLAMSEDSGTRTYMGEIAAETSIALYHPLGGKLLQLHVHNGQRVDQGQAVADMDDTQPRSMHEAAVATLKQAEDAYHRLQQVHQSGGVSEVKWVEMQTNLEKARQQEALTRKSLEDCHLTAPISGVVSDMNVHQGQQLLPGQAVCTILGLQTLQVVFAVPESEVATFAVGDTVRLILNAKPEDVYSAVLTEKGLSAGKVAHTYPLKARLLRTDKDILPGMVAKVQTTQQGVQGLVVPSGCVQTTQEGPAVWVVRDGKARRQQLGATRFVHDGVLVAEGLNPGDKVVVAGYQKLFNGASVLEK